jgi:starvation-inducible DNA-binding protein
MNKKSKTLSLATPSDLPLESCKLIAEVLNPLVADAFALYIKTKNYHWHLSGSHFRDYHLMFDEQAAQIFATIDTLAERVRKLGQTSIHSVGQISKLQTIKDDDEEFVQPREMLQRLLEDNKKCLRNMRKAHKICDENNDAATASFLEVFIDETERRVWFLFESHKSDS